MVFTNARPFPHLIGSASNITPFTYTDGTTYLSQLEQMREWLNEYLVPAFNTGIDNAIAEYQAGLGNAEAYVDEMITYINNKTGTVEVQRVTLNAPYTVQVDPQWPTNHPVDLAIKQNHIGGYPVTLGPNITGPLTVNPAANSVTEFTLIPRGDGTWKVFQLTSLLGDLWAAITSTDGSVAALEDLVDTVNAAVTALQNQVDTALPLKADKTALALTDAAVTALGTSKQDKSTAVVSDYRTAVIACVLRNDGSGWYALDDTGHTPINIDSVTSDGTAITINYSSLGATEVASLAVVPDEKLGQHGFFAGASVGTTQAVIKLSQAAPRYTDYVQYVAGTGWVSTNGVFNPSFSSGILTLTHTPLLNPDSVFDVQVLPRTGPTASFDARISGAGDAVDDDNIKIEFYNSAGALQTANGDNMRVFVSHGGGTRTVDPSTVTTTSYVSSNLFVMGLVRIP